MIGKGIAGVSGYLYILLLNKILTPAEYGTYVLAFTIVMTASLLIDGGFAKLLLYKIPQFDDEEKADDLSANILLWEIILSLLLIILFIKGSSAVSLFFNNPQLSNWIKVLSPIILLNAVKNFYLAWLRAKHRIFENVLINEILFPLFKITALLIVFFISDKPLFISFALSSAIFLSFSKWLKSDPVWKSLNIKSLTKEDWVYTFQLMWTRLFNHFINRMDILMIGYLLTSNMVAEYKIAWKLSILVRYGDDILTKIFVPRISAYFAKQNFTEFREEFDFIRRSSLLIGLISATLLIIFGRDLIFIFGDYNLVYKMLVVLLAGWIFNLSLTNIGNTLQMAGKGNLVFYNQFFLFFFNFAGNYILINKFGVLGGCLATVISQVIMNLVTYIEVLLSLKINLYSLSAVSITVSFIIGMLLTAFGLVSYTLFSLVSIILILFLLYQLKSDLKRLRGGILNGF